MNLFQASGHCHFYCNYNQVLRTRRPGECHGSACWPGAWLDWAARARHLTPSEASRVSIGCHLWPSPHTRFINLAYNTLNGTLPTEWVGLSSLTGLTLAGNRLVGPVPSVMVGLPSLRSLDLSSNLLNSSLQSSYVGMDALT
jgi:hypothetical protein